MKITRRNFIAGSAIIAGSNLVGLNSPAWAEASLEYGNKKIIVLSDGKLRLPTSLLFDGLDPNDYLPVLKRYGVVAENQQPDCNLTLYRDENRTILFDVGAGPSFMPSTGKIIEAFEAIDLSPDDVTDVVFTHAHPDHLWGLFDDFDELVFSQADYHISKTEWAYWTNEDTINTIGESRQAFAAGAKRLLTALEDKIVRFETNQEVLPGVFAHNTSGHTPGHNSFELNMGSENIMVLGDCIGNAHLAFEHPDWVAGMDQEQDQAADTRKKLLNRLVDENYSFIGFHFPYPGIGKADRFGDGFKFIAA